MGNWNSISRSEIEKLRKKVDMTPDEIRQMHAEYKKSCRYGKQLTTNDFHDIYKELSSGDSTKFTEHIFRAFDTNKNGYVDFEEFLIGYCVTSSHDIDKKLRWAFTVYDIDGNGTIDLGEMKEIMKAAYKMHPERGSGTSDQLAEKLFKEMDTNGDGVISWEEFQQGAKKDPTVQKILEFK